MFFRERYRERSRNYQHFLMPKSGNASEILRVLTKTSKKLNQNRRFTGKKKSSF